MGTGYLRSEVFRGTREYPDMAWFVLVNPRDDGSVEIRVRAERFSVREAPAPEASVRMSPRDCVLFSAQITDRGYAPA